MKKLFVTSAFILLSGCATIIPINRHFPDAVPELLIQCPNLKQTLPTTKLSDVIDTVVDNYGQYHACQSKENQWIIWYRTQKDNFNNASKKK